MGAYERKDRPGTWRAEGVLDGRRFVVNAKSKGEAEAKLRAKLRAFSRGQGVSGRSGRSVTLGAYLAAWLDRKEGTIRDSTIERYRQQAALLKGDEIERTRLDQLTSARLTEAFTRASKSGKGSSSIGKLRTMIVQALEDAIPDHIGHNPARRSRAPKHEPRALAVPTDDETRRVLHAVAGTEHELLFTVAIGAGLRSGELFGLTWSNVSSDRISITHQLNRSGKIAPLKTKASKRTVEIGEAAIAALRAQRAKTGAGEFVFVDDKGKPLSHEHFRRRIFDPALKMAGLAGRFTPHGFFRHGASTFLISAGVDPRTVKDRLGHANISTTLGIYTTARGQQKAVDAISDLLAGDSLDES